MMLLYLKLTNLYLSPAAKSAHLCGVMIHKGFVTHPFYQVNAFTTERFRGNTAGVCLLTDSAAAVDDAERFDDTAAHFDGPAAHFDDPATLFDDTATLQAIATEQRCFTVGNKKHGEQEKDGGFANTRPVGQPFAPALRRNRG